MKEKNKCCMDCKFLHQGKMLPYIRSSEELDNHWVYFDVCTVLPQTEDGYSAFALIIEDSLNNYCEMYAE